VAPSTVMSFRQPLAICWSLRLTLTRALADMIGSHL
jgi:hypothetical protein